MINRDTICGEQLAHRNPGFVHKRGWLRHNKVESEHAAGMHHRRVALLPTATPLHAIGEGVQDQPGDVVSRVAILLARVPESHNETTVNAHVRFLFIAAVCARRMSVCSRHIAA